jgi:hypothetical protein
MSEKMMTHAEQHRMIDELRDYMNKMKGKDYYDFEMFWKRDRDDEDLDEISKKRLVELYEKYYRKK